MKVGRNGPCPCGSGKKYKKCCLSKHENITNNFPLNHRWSEKEVYDLDSETIIGHLISFGIPVTEENFKREIRNVGSVEELISKWEKLYHLNINDFRIDFTFLAIKVLASRLAPTHLLLEQIDDLMQEGYVDEELNRLGQAVVKWMDVWQKTLQWLGDKKKITSIRELDDLVSPYMSQLYSNWVSDFEMTLGNAERHNVQYATMKIDFVNEFMEKFPNSDSLMVHNMIVAKGESLFLLRKFDEADAVFEEHIKNNPDNLWTYVRWGDLYNPEMHSILPDKERSIYLYRKAIEIDSDPYDREAVEDRLYELTQI